MKYRVYKERRLLRPYKVQVLDGQGWTDCVRITRIKHHALVRTIYYWTKRRAERVIRQDCNAESIYE